MHTSPCRHFLLVLLSAIFFAATPALAAKGGNGGGNGGNGKGGGGGGEGEDANGALSSQPTGTTKTLTNYGVEAKPENIGITSANQPPTSVEVFGEPRVSKKHPYTLLDKEDFAGLKKAITSNEEAKKAYDLLKQDADGELGKPLAVPVAQKGPDGQWMYPGDIMNVGKKIGDVTERNGKIAANMGMMYQFTNDAKYGAYAKKILLAYADNYNNWGHPPGWTPKKYHSAQDGRITGQFLEDGVVMCRFAFAYDLVHDLPGWTEQERTHLRDDFFRVIEEEYGPVSGNSSYLGAEHNRSCICTSGVLMAGYACDDDRLLNDAMYGWQGTKDKPNGGLFAVHFDKCIQPDGLWIEGAPGYQLGIASCGLFNDAETLWHHGIDMYRYRNGVLKQMLKTAIYMAYPNDKMNLLKLHDSQGEGLLEDKDWLTNEVGVPYECGYRRYHEAQFLPIVYNASKQLSQTTHGGAVSLFLTDLPPKESAPPRPMVNVNFYATGLSFQRIKGPDGYTQLAQEFGPSAGHGHPSKLSIDIFGLGEVLMPLPGVIFPYNDPLDSSWFWTTVGNCTMVVDEQDQLYSKNKFRDKKNPDAVAIQAVYAPAETIGMQRAESNTIQPGITEDRSLFMAPEYVADIFGGFDTAPHTYDMAWHLRGKLSTALKTEPFTFPTPTHEGYNAITDPTHATTSDAWSLTSTLDSGKTVRFVAASGTPTEVILGGGHYMVNKQDTHPPVFLQRRTAQNEALFGNAIDLSGDAAGFVKSVAQDGGLTAGYGLLKVTTTKGTDLCFTAYRPGSYTAGGLTTDGLQAFVRMDGKNVASMYLAGGTSLKSADATLQRSAPGLAYFEKTDKGYVVGNPSSTEATVTVTFPALKALQAFKLNDDGKSAGPADVKRGTSVVSVELKLKPMEKVLFSGS